jgi:hypothetical protein
MARVRNGGETLSGYRPATMLAATECACVDAFDGFLDLGEDLLFFADHVERDFLLKLMAAKVSQVKRHI